MPPLTKFEQTLTIRCWAIGDSTCFSARFLRGKEDFMRLLLGRWVTELGYTELEDDIGAIWFPICCSVSKPERLKDDGQKSRPNFIFFTPGKNYGRVGEMSKSILRVRLRTKPLTYVWRAVAQRSERFESGCKKGQQQNRKPSTYVETPGINSALCVWVICVTNFGKIGQSVATLSRFNHLQYVCRLPSWIWS